MGLAIDTILSSVADATTGFVNTTTTNSNDSLTVRNYPTSAGAKITSVIRGHDAIGGVRVLSPLLHDNVTGMTWYSGETVSVHEMPPYLGQPAQPGDTLTVQVQGDNSNPATVGTVIYYQDLTGASANLYQWGDISGAIKSIKPMTVAVTSSATIGAWVDTLITVTENQLHATSYYAVLGFATSVQLSLIGIKSQATGNLRICGPGTVLMQDTTYYFVDEANRMGVPFIPVFNGQDRAAVFCSVANYAASTASNITLVLAELTGSNWSRS